jgi:hypothetical protein
MLQQEHKRLMHRLRLDQVVVVKDQHQLAWHGGQVIEGVRDALVMWGSGGASGPGR